MTSSPDARGESGGPREPRSRDAVGPGEFREAMGRLAAGVSVVTSVDSEGLPRGLTATAVCSVSLVPPLVLASVSRGTSTHAAIEHAQVFALNLLGRGEEEVARRFALASESKFADLDWREGVTGSPTLSEALAVCECELEQAVPAGDHTLFIGRVVRIDLNRSVPNDPLIYFSGRYEAISGSGPDGGSP